MSPMADAEMPDHQHCAATDNPAVVRLAGLAFFSPSPCFDFGAFQSLHCMMDKTSAAPKRRTIAKNMPTTTVSPSATRARPLMLVIGRAKHSYLSIRYPVLLLYANVLRSCRQAAPSEPPFRLALTGSAEQKFGAR
jgi:hypothetical protein